MVLTQNDEYKGDVVNIFKKKGRSVKYFKKLGFSGTVFKW